MFVILDEVTATPVLDYVKKNECERIQSPTRYAWLRQAYRVATLQRPQSVRLQKPMTY